MKVQISFNLAANGVGSYFTLDDTTKGVLDNVTYLLAGDVLVDITSGVRSVQVRRGRSHTLERFTAGNANITLDNRDRAYDPLNTSSPYYGSIIPRKEVRIDVNSSYLFVGNVEDWNFGYTVSGDSIAEVSCIDGMAFLSSQSVPAGTATSQLTGARVTAVLDALAWPSTNRSISTGQATLDADVRTADISAVDYLSKVALSDPGAFFVARDGKATFKDRTNLQTFSDSGVTFGTGGVPFMEIGVVYGTEEMTNSASVVWSNGASVGGTALAEDLTAQASYGVMEATYNTLLDTSADALTLANWIVGQYSQPRYRIDTVRVRLGGMTTGQQVQVLGLDLGSVVLVTWTPNGTGTAISQYATIDGIQHDATPAAHDITFTMSETLAAFVLSSSTFGQLDDDHLGF